MVSLGSVLTRSSLLSALTLVEVVCVPSSISSTPLSWWVRSSVSCPLMHQCTNKSQVSSSSSLFSTSSSEQPVDYLVVFLRANICSPSRIRDWSKETGCKIGMQKTGLLPLITFDAVVNVSIHNFIWCESGTNEPRFISLVYSWCLCTVSFRVGVCVLLWCSHFL